MVPAAWAPAPMGALEKGRRDAMATAAPFNFA